ncbi:MAG: hypothetical protein ACRC2T_20290, partial [Thermoguttaceae bacterium]
MKTITPIIGSILFCGITVSAFAAEDDANESKPPYYMTDEHLDKSLGVNDDAQKPEQFLQVIYFHRVPGCDTCQLMSKYIYETVKTKFPEEVKNKNIVLR